MKPTKRRSQGTKKRKKKWINKNYGSIFGDHISLPVYFLSIRSLSITLEFSVGSSSKCATVMTDKKNILYANLYGERQRDPLWCISFHIRKATSNTQSSITWQKVYTNFRAQFLCSTHRGGSSIVHVDRAFDIYNSGPFALCCFFWLAAHMLLAFTHTHMTQTHVYSAICFRLPWHTLIHSLFYISWGLVRISHTCTPTRRHIVSCVMKSSNQFA